MEVSIHAFRGEGDGRSRRHNYERCGFNPRLPGGRRPHPAGDVRTSAQFQSTPSGGKATRDAGADGRRINVSIHAFRGEGDVVPRRRNRPPVGFQSTPSGGKATIALSADGQSAAVSIHAFRGEGDVERAGFSVAFSVSIHAFRGEGDATDLENEFFTREFQSTPSGGKATAPLILADGAGTFQSTPSGGKATARMLRTRGGWWFQSTPSGGKATSTHR